MSPAGDWGGGRSSPFYTSLLTRPASCCWRVATLAFLLPLTQQSLLTVPVKLNRNLPPDVEILSIRSCWNPPWNKILFITISLCSIQTQRGHIVGEQILFWAAEEMLLQPIDYLAPVTQPCRLAAQKGTQVLQILSDEPHQICFSTSSFVGGCLVDPCYHNWSGMEMELIGWRDRRARCIFVTRYVCAKWTRC